MALSSPASTSAPSYGQIVIGAPGAGKTTFCEGARQLLKKLKRPVVLVNLDPANDLDSFEADIDIRELITVEDAMRELNLGPNGALRYCMKTLAANITWLRWKMKSYPDHYVIIDMPGQLELYTSDDSISTIITQLSKWNWRMVAVHLSDCTYVSDPGKFIAVILSALSIMVNLEVPQVNVLSKVDLMPRDAAYDLDFYEGLQDLGNILHLIDDNPVLAKYKSMNAELCEMIQSYGLVGFMYLDVSDKERMLNLLKAADEANGFSVASGIDMRAIVGR